MVRHLTTALIAFSVLSLATGGSAVAGGLKPPALPPRHTATKAVPAPAPIRNVSISPGEALFNEPDGMLGKIDPKIGGKTPPSST
jgi:hypothetical protein